MLTLDASNGFFRTARYDVEATLPGYNSGQASISAGLDGWYVGNIVFGGLIGFLIVDPATGAMWKLDDRVVVNLGASPAAELASALSQPPSSFAAPAIAAPTPPEIPAEMK